MYSTRYTGAGGGPCRGNALRTATAANSAKNAVVAMKCAFCRKASRANAQVSPVTATTTAAISSEGHTVASETWPSAPSSTAADSSRIPSTR